MSSSFYQRLTAVLTMVTERVTALPIEGGLVSKGGSGLNLHAGNPIVPLAVAESDADVTTLQSTQTVLLDARDMTLWEFSGTWTSRTYQGDESLLRPQSLCYSGPTNQLYYYGLGNTLTRVNRTAASTPP